MAARMLKAGLDRLTCDGVLRRLDDYLDRALTPGELGRVQAHLADCLSCASRSRFEASVIERVRDRLQRIAAPSNLLEAVRARLSAASG
jgi:anti-sigma factor (TIGR02949 family)